MSQEAQPLGVASITKNGANFTVGLLPSPTIINSFSGTTQTQVVINAFLVAHVQADQTGNVAVVLRAGPAKLGPFYAQLTSSNNTMSIDLNMKAKNPDSSATDLIDVLTGKATLTFAFTSPKSLSMVTNSFTGMLLNGGTGGFTNPRKIINF